MIMGNPASPAVALRLTVLLLVVPVAYVGSFVVFSYATLDIRDGRWAILIIEHLAHLDQDTLGLLGARSRFVWSALTVIFALTMLTATAFSLTVLARRSGALWVPVLGALLLVSIAVGVGAWFLGPSQFASCVASPCSDACATRSTGAPFLIIPYMGAVFCRTYDPAFVSFFWRFFSVAGALQTSINILFFAAAFSLIVGPKALERWTVAELRRRVADFRWLVILASVMLTLTGITELTLWGWLAEIATGWDQGHKVRDLQVGSALYWGGCNSALLLLVFAPLGSLLAEQARALARRHNEDAATSTLETWQRDHHVTLTGRAAWPQVVGVLAPLLTGALTFLIQSALGAG